MPRWRQLHVNVNEDDFQSLRKMFPKWGQVTAFIREAIETAIMIEEMERAELKREHDREEKEALDKIPGSELDLEPTPPAEEGDHA